MIGLAAFVMALKANGFWHSCPCNRCKDARRIVWRLYANGPVCDECGAQHGPGNTNTLCSRSANCRWGKR